MRNRLLRAAIAAAAVAAAGVLTGWMGKAVSAPDPRRLTVRQQFQSEHEQSQGELRDEDQ
jgi:hypothetical protein